MSLSLIDVSPRRQIHEGAVFGALRAALALGGAHANNSSNRFDSDGPVDLRGDALDEYHRYVDGENIRLLESRNRGPWRPGPRLQALAQQRADALPIGAGGFPRDFEFIRAQVFEEKRQPLTAMQYFPVDGSVPLGAKWHTARRALGSGEARIYRGQGEIPVAHTTFAEERFNVAYVVCSVEQNFFEMLSSDFAGLQQYTRDLRLANRLVEERLNRIAWYGDVGAQMYGLCNYPGMAKTQLAVAFIDSNAAEDIAAAILDFINTPMVQTGGTFYADSLFLSPEDYAYIFTRKHSTTGGSDLTIGEYVLRAMTVGGRPGRIVPVPELAGAALQAAGIGSGQNGIVAGRMELDAIGHVLIQAPTPLPVFNSTPLDQTTVVFGATGGIVAPDHGNFIFGLVPTS